MNINDYLDESLYGRIVAEALDEDIGDGDITTLGTLNESEQKESRQAKLLAKSDGTLSGARFFELAFSLHTPSADSVNCQFFFKDGQCFSSGQTLAEITAPLATLLSAERVALNFLGHLSGIATSTFRFVNKINNSACMILDTRKTTPGWRLLEKYAVACGGGVNHRRGLYDMALIKENHITSAGSITRAVENMRAYLQSENINAELEVEVRNETELREALKQNVGRILLDNQTVESLRHLVTIARKSSPETKLEASGNISLDNVQQIAESGVDFVSIGALTHSSVASDFSLLIEAE